MVHSLLDGAAFFTSAQVKIPHASKAAVTKSARLIRDEAKRVLGTYDYGWVPLQPETIANKAHGDTPLLETGELRRSIKYSVSGSYMNWTAHVGSDNPKALWHELGTSRIPARSFLAGAAIRMESRVHEICGHDLFAMVFSHRHFDPDADFDVEE